MASAFRDAERGQRRWLLIGLSVALSVVALIFFIHRSVEGDQIFSPTMGAIAAIAVGGLLAAIFAWRSEDTRVPGVLFLLLAFPATGFIAYRNGGLDAPAIIWMAILPLLAGYWVGPVCAFVVGLLVTALTGSLLHLELTGGLPPPSSDPKYLVVTKAMTISLVALFLSFVAWLYRRVHVTARRTMRKLADELDAQRERLLDAYNQLELERQRAEAASEAKSQFVANVSHEIRTPIHGVLGMAELLQRSPLNPEQRDYVAAIVHSAETLASLIEDVLDFSRIEAGRIQLRTGAFRPWELVEDVARSLAGQAQAKGIEIVCDAPLDLPPQLEGDATRLRQILFNLAGNAVKFTDRGHVALRVRWYGPTEAPGGRGRLVIEVEDTGPGIAPEDQARIFEAFTQLDAAPGRRHGGTGLGLAICRLLVELLEGEISLESELGQGTTFHVEIPMRALEVARRAQHWPQLQGHRILVASSCDALTAVLVRELRREGADAAPIDDQQLLVDQLRAAAELGAPWSIVVVEREVAEAGDWELCQQVEQALASSALPAWMLLTPMRRGGRPDWSLRSPLAGVLLRPFAPRRLLDALEAYASGKPVAAAAHIQDTLPHAAGDQVVLVLEDNAISQQVIAAMLRHLGYSADVYADPDRAIERATVGSYAAILLDCHLPGKDGFEVSRAIRAREPKDRHVAIIAVTADTQVSTRRRCINAGMDDFLPKPFTIADLAAVLARHLRPAAHGSAVRR